MVLAQYRRPHSGQKHVLYTLVDPSSAPPKPVLAGLGWSRRVLPPGPKGLLRRPFIAISGLRRHPQYKRGRLRNEDPSSRRGTAANFVAGVNHVGTLVNG